MAMRYALSLALVALLGGCGAGAVDASPLSPSTTTPSAVQSTPPETSKALTSGSPLSAATPAATGEPFHDLHIDFILYDTNRNGGAFRVTRDGKPKSCRGQGGFQDISPSSDIVVKNGKGEMIGLTTLGSGQSFRTSYDRKRTADFAKYPDLADMMDDQRTRAMGCRFKVTVSDLPETEFYEVRIGHRTNAYSLANLHGSNWLIALTLGR